MAISVGWVSFSITEGTGERGTISPSLGERSAGLGQVLCDAVRPHHVGAVVVGCDLRETGEGVWGIGGMVEEEIGNQTTNRSAPPTRLGSTLT